MWLNGFNDNLVGYPKVECDMVPCPAPYMGPDQPGAPPDPALGKQGPYGTGESTPEFGMCPIDKAFPNDSNVMRDLALAKMNAFDRSTHGQFFWNFRTEMESKWDFQQVVGNGWLPNRDEKQHLSGRIRRDVTASCAMVGQTERGVSSASGSSWGLVVVWTVSIALIIGLICAIGIFASKASGHDMTFLENMWFNRRAQIEGYSVIGTNFPRRDVEMM